MENDILINKLRVIINHLPLMSSEKQFIAIGSANCMLDAYFLTGGKFIKTRADDCMPPNQANQHECTTCGCKAEIQELCTELYFCYNCIT